MELRNRKWTDEEFNEYLAKVRSWYPTGRDVDLDEAVDYHRRMPEAHNLVKAETQAAKEGRILICPRVGFATVEQTLETIVYTRENGGADFVRIAADSYTRRMAFDRAKKAIEESRSQGRSLLNGFPTVVHGVAENRRLYEAADLPISTTCSAAHQELHFLITLAAGSTEVVGDAFSSVFQENSRLADIIIFTQFMDRLTGWYAERGIPIFKSHKFVGVLTPPSIRVASPILGALLAAEQGVTEFSLEYTTNLSVVQDVAAQRVLNDLGKEYLARFGYKATVTQGLNHFSGAHPTDRASAFSYVALVAAIARWGGATRIETKTVDEGSGVPPKESQAMSYRATKEMLYLLRNQPFPDSEELALEYRMIEAEARSMIDKALELGDGDAAIGSVKALESGALDFTYPVSKHILGRVVSARDNSGAVRFLDCGNLPFSREIREFHRERIARRKQAESKKDYQLIIDDLRGRAASASR